MQFFAILCFLITLYYNKRKVFYISILGISGLCLIIQLIVIFQNDLSASYLTYQDEYWTIYHYKPYTRIHGYLIGLWLGCEYFSFKHEIQSIPKNISDDGSSNNSRSEDSEHVVKSLIEQAFEAMRD